ncbi:hypothetical protein [Bosea sp. 685]|uniref:hypothetical protein n=1 Tax=Bosea sp. 685 TaxID=3080057 RepID=UPI002892EA8E|nr:hypothetical protein [Bosea sp. 685]WNJ91775.1 hypothetical protein RMR04_05570 [Bosea sp. 685]
MAMAKASKAASDTTTAERMSHADAGRILMDIWSRTQVVAIRAEGQRAAELKRELEALSVAMTALEVVTRLGGE